MHDQLTIKNVELMTFLVYPLSIENFRHFLIFLTALNTTEIRYRYRYCSSETLKLKLRQYSLIQYIADGAIFKEHFLSKLKGGKLDSSAMI